MRTSIFLLFLPLGCIDGKDTAVEPINEPVDEPIDVVEPTIDTIPELTSLLSCATSNSTGDLIIVATDPERTAALVLRETGGYPSGQGEWDNGFDNQVLSIELRLGTNVGVNHCTDIMQELSIREVFAPIDISEVPEAIGADEVSRFSYQALLLECEDCVPMALLSIENFWFRSEENNYAQVQLADFLETEILFNYGG